MDKGELHSGVKSVQTTLTIIQFLHEAGAANIRTIAEGIGIGSSTAHRHLATLRERNYVVSENGEYRLGFQFLTHGGRIRNRIPEDDLIIRKVDQLMAETDERVQFIVEEHGERVYVFTRAGENAVKTDATIGKRGPLHVSAAGKTILANLPADRREEIIQTRSMKAHTEDTITDTDRLEAELELVREQGYAFNDEESTEGLRAVGVPIHYEDGQILGALSISGPANRLKGDYFRIELRDLLMGTVNEIELNLKYSGSHVAG